MDEKSLLRLARTHGTPVVIVDHKALRENYAQFRKYLPRVQAYYAVKANCAPEIVRTFHEEGASFDVASMAEFLAAHENVKDLPEDQLQHFIWDRIYANPFKATETLEQLDPYKPLVTYDNHEEAIKIARHARHAGLVLRLGVPNTRSMVELSSKFGAINEELRTANLEKTRADTVDAGLPRMEPPVFRPGEEVPCSPGLKTRGSIRIGKFAQRYRSCSFYRAQTMTEVRSSQVSVRRRGSVR